MPFPTAVVTTVVTGRYLDASGKPAKGYVSFKPDLSALGEGITVASIAVRRPLDADGAFSIELPASVNTGLDPDFTYEYSVQIAGSSYPRRIYQIPVSVDDVDIEELVPTTTLPSRARFIFPTWTTAPTNPRPGEVYYDPATGDSSYWNAVLEVWVPIVAGSGGGGGAPSGPAGGSLTGTYPNPTLKTNSVDTAQLKDASVTAAKLSVSYVPTLTYNNDLATTATALGDLEEMIGGKADLVHTHIIGNVTGLQVALDAKAPTASPTFTGTVSGITKAMVGLGNVDNTSDANKPVSTATSAALALKADLVGGVIPTGQIPAIAITEVFTAANQAAMLALTAQRGDMALRTDNGHRYVLSTDSPGTLADWIDLGAATDAVASVNGQTGIVVLGKTDVGLSNVDNTSDAAKPVSTATQTALNLKANLASPTFTGTVGGITKAMVGLGSVDNTSDAAKPISTATQTALNLKANTASLAAVATSGDYNDLINTPGGGGGTAATFARAYITSGDFANTVDAVWTPVSGLTISIAAVVGDNVEALYGCLLDLGISANNFYDPCVIVGGSIVRFASTGTGTSAGANEGDPAIYPNAGSRFRGADVSFNFTATSGDISGGNITFGMAHIGPGGGKVFANTNYPFRWTVRNDH
jgi:hypothetical protein